MTLYHATRNENIYSIENDGLMVSGETARTFGYTRESSETGVYGFATADDAQAFADENGWIDAGIFSFETDCGQIDRVIPDPEYSDGIAYIAIPYGYKVTAALAK